MIEITTTEFNRIRDYIKTHYAIALSDEKKTLVSSRLRATLTDLGFANFTDYFNYLLKEQGDAMVHFIDKITTNHTFFMRETDHFDYLRDITLPFIHQKWGAQKDLRMWCAASSSGEESVTLQIIAQEFCKKIGEKWDTQMLASDLCTKVLDKAVAARYPTEALENLPKQWITDHFNKVDKDFHQVNDKIRKEILYRKKNLMDPFNFKKKFQVIFCRNVMIYFDNDTRDDIVRRFYDITEPGGYLFIGHSESVSNSRTGFEYIKPAIYQKPM